MGLGMVVDQLADLKLGELLDTPPPGLDEAVAIAKARTRPLLESDMTNLTLLSLCESSDCHRMGALSQAPVSVDDGMLPSPAIATGGQATVTAGLYTSCCADRQVVQFVRAEEYARFSRIIFDTAPTGHTLRLLAVPDFVDASLGKIIRLRKKLGSAGTALRGLFGASEQQDSAVQKLESLQVIIHLQPVYILITYQSQPPYKSTGRRLCSS